MRPQILSAPSTYLCVDRDSAQWKLEDKIVQRRRNLFWELFIFEIMHVYIIVTPFTRTRSHLHVCSASLSAAHPAQR